MFPGIFTPRTSMTTRQTATVQLACVSQHQKAEHLPPRSLLLSVNQRRQCRGEYTEGEDKKNNI